MHVRGVRSYVCMHRFAMSIDIIRNPHRLVLVLRFLVACGYRDLFRRMCSARLLRMYWFVYVYI